ncbi:hypothetical protein NQ317_013635, partial [Molorchus minor]
SSLVQNTEAQIRAKVFVDNWSLKHLLYFEYSGYSVVLEKSRVGRYCKLTIEFGICNKLKNENFELQFACPNNI